MASHVRNTPEIDLNVHSMENSRTPEALDKLKRNGVIKLDRLNAVINKTRKSFRKGGLSNPSEMSGKTNAFEILKRFEAWKGGVQPIRLLCVCVWWICGQIILKKEAKQE
ncbi:Hypothetical predicted protein [Paramuricea clavata]|uniref:Uncharacterized protein n=1 Tax=Paramuricea clavata TaxID=317549 RepID=A0A6S7H5Y7_PARCT|nr:Hypothetical predicted protein [Paramuricea clavata]